MVISLGDRGAGYILHNDVIVENGIIVSDFSISGRVIWGQEYLDEELKNGTEIIIKSDSFVLYSKKKVTTSAPNTIIPKDRVGDVLEGRSGITSLFGTAVFSYPKPGEFIKVSNGDIKFFRFPHPRLLLWLSHNRSRCDAVECRRWW